MLISRGNRTTGAGYVNTTARRFANREFGNTKGKGRRFYSNVPWKPVGYLNRNHALKTFGKRPKKYAADDDNSADDLIAVLQTRSGKADKVYAAGVNGGADRRHQRNACGVMYHPRLPYF